MANPSSQPGGNMSSPPRRVGFAEALDAVEYDLRNAKREEYEPMLAELRGVVKSVELERAMRDEMATQDPIQF